MTDIGQIFHEFENVRRSWEILKKILERLIIRCINKENNNSMRPSFLDHGNCTLQNLNVS